MKGQLLLRERHQLTEDAFVELVIWRVPEAKRGSDHVFKYRLAYVVSGACVLRYDNEIGKGDHIHRGDVEMRYHFTTADQLLSDFWSDVDRWRKD